MKTPEEITIWCDMMLNRHPNVEDTNFFNSIKNYMKEQRQPGEWIKDRNPDKDGAYLCITGIGGLISFRHILYFTRDLYKKDPYTFYEYRYKRKDKRSGWYDFCEYGYFEITRVLAWCELPEMPEEFRVCKKEAKK